MGLMRDGTVSQLLACRKVGYMNTYGGFNNNSPWRNWLARSTVNREVGSSSLPGEVFFDFY